MPHHPGTELVSSELQKGKKGLNLAFPAKTSVARDSVNLTCSSAGWQSLM